MFQTFLTIGRAASTPAFRRLVVHYIIDYISSWKIHGKQLTENDIISVQVGSDFVTWECFKESVKDILCDTYNNDDLIIGDIQMYGKNFIMYLDHDGEYCSYSWDALFIPDSLEPSELPTI